MDIITTKKTRLYIIIHNICMTMLERLLGRVLLLLMFCMLSVHCNQCILTILLTNILLSHYLAQLQNHKLVF